MDPSMTKNFGEAMCVTTDTKASSFKDNFAVFIHKATTKDIVSIANHFCVVKYAIWFRGISRKCKIDRPTNQVKHSRLNASPWNNSKERRNAGMIANTANSKDFIFIMVKLYIMLITVLTIKDSNSVARHVE